MSNRLVGAVFAGGESRRMGCDKRRVERHGEPLWRHAAGLLEPICSRVLILYGDRRLVDLDAPYEGVSDIRSGIGPIGGLESALLSSGDRPLIALACDLPQVESEDLAALVEQSRAQRGVVAMASSEGRPQPLCAVYPAGVLETVQEQIDRDEYSLRALLARLPVAMVEVSSDSLLNLNRPSDLERWQARISEGRADG